MIKIIFCDVDGTLLNSSHIITPLTRQKILELNDIPFVIVSARSPSGIYPIQRKNGICCPIIAYSGALIQDEKGQVIYQKGMNYSLAEEIICFIEEKKLSLTWCLYSGDRWIVRDKCDPKVQREEEIVEAEAEEGSVRSLAKGQDVHKILCICDPGTIDEIESQIKAAFPDVNAVKSSDILLEIMDKNVSKAGAVSRLCQHLGLSLEEAAAFGDNYNDLDMLAAVGYGVVMGNAPAIIQARFEHVTDDNDHDGIAKELMRITKLLHF